MLSKQVLPPASSSLRQSLQDYYITHKWAEPPLGDGSLQFYAEPTPVAKNMATCPSPFLTQVSTPHNAETQEKVKETRVIEKKNGGMLRKKENHNPTLRR